MNLKDLMAKQRAAHVAAQAARPHSSARIEQLRDAMTHNAKVATQYMPPVPVAAPATSMESLESIANQVEAIVADEEVIHASDVHALETIETYESEDDESPNEYDTREDVEVADDGSLVINGVTNIMDGMTHKLDPSQEAAVMGMAQAQRACLIGAAGTGKTTTTRVLLHTLLNGHAEAGIKPMQMAEVDLSQYHGNDETKRKNEANKRIIPSIVLCAFTGQATQVLKKNMPGTWKQNVMTIHSMLGYAPAEYYDNRTGKTTMRFEPTYTKANKMPWDCYIVDEASMVNLDLWHQVLDASKPTARFYFVGDINQLTPPIGVGVLGFALAAWEVFELTHVHRQADDSANRIVDTAHAILKGTFKPEMFDKESDPRWRVIGGKLSASAGDAHKEILGTLNMLRTMRVSKLDDPNEPFVYDPWRDRVLTTTNGFNEDDGASYIGQYPINMSCARLFADEDKPPIIIDAKRSIKKFAVGYRIMATKNEGPHMKDRVTNGLTGKILDIQENLEWMGDRRLVGLEATVMQNRREMLAESVKEKTARFAEQLKGISHKPTSEPTKDDNGGGPCSHIVTVHYDNGANRIYKLNTSVDQLQIAYASTTHKAQGAEAPTVIIIVHHAAARMLCRENLYTAITRASQRVIILYTDHGLRRSLAIQKITGSTLREKLVKYQNMMAEDVGLANLKGTKARLTHDDR